MNTAVPLSKLGVKSSLISKVADSNGNMLVNELKKDLVSVDGWWREGFRNTVTSFVLVAKIREQSCPCRMSNVHRRIINF